MRINLISNAIKYNRATGWVSVSLQPGDAQRVRIAIEDTGPGLTAQQLGRLFQPFERLGHESSAIEGAGFGLVIARRLVEETGGVITLSSAPQAGTLALSELPAAQPEPVLAPPGPAALRCACSMSRTTLATRCCSARRCACCAGSSNCASPTAVRAPWRRYRAGRPTC